MQSSQNQQSPNTMDQKSVNFRSIIKAFEVIIRTQSDEQKKKHCQQILQKFKSTKIGKILTQQLNRQCYLKLIEARNQLKYFRNAFQRITDQVQQYKKFKIANGLIVQQLITLQDKIDARDFKSSYLRALLIKKKQFQWSKQFIQDWVKSADQQKLKQEQDKKQKQLERNKQVKNQPLPQIGQNAQNATNANQTVLPSSQVPKLEQKKASSRPTQKSTQKIQGQKPQKKVKKDETGQKIEKISKAKLKKQGDQSQSSQNQQIKETIKKKVERDLKQYERFNQPKQPKNRVKLLRQYLANRKDMASLAQNPRKLDQMAEFLNQNLQKFMKHHLNNLIQAAKLRNMKILKQPSIGDQFSYFSKQGCNLFKPSSSLQVCQEGAKMAKVTYKSKLELYSLLRVREQMLEQSLMKLYSSKKDAQMNKTGDKKLWQYLLRPSQVIQKAQNYIQSQQRATDRRLSIQMNHVRYLFQSHKYIRNSWLMMFCYNS